jgi:hypothetical protein
VPCGFDLLFTSTDQGMQSIELGSLAKRKPSPVPIMTVIPGNADAAPAGVHAGAVGVFRG